MTMNNRLAFKIATWLSWPGLALLILYTAYQLYFAQEYEHIPRTFVWPRIFVVAFPLFLIFSHIGLWMYASYYSLILIGIFMYICGIPTTYLVVRWRMKHMP